MTRWGTTATLLLALALIGSLLAPATAPAAAAASSTGSCSGQGNAGAATAVQERAMLCLVNRARRQHGLGALAQLTSLHRAARHKSADVLRCDEFSHEACGREFTYWMGRFGYSGCREGENIAWGTGPYATPRSIFQMWMHSPGHRSNILGPYTDTGLGLEVGTLEGYGGAHVWTEEFGSRSC